MTRNNLHKIMIMDFRIFRIFKIKQYRFVLVKATIVYPILIYI